MTLRLMLLAAAVGGIAMWRVRIKRPFGQVRLMPWNGILFASLLALLVLAAHMLSLVTGSPVGQQLYRVP